MSCNYDTSCPTRTFFRLFLFLAVSAILLSNAKEILRYIRISTM